jgi:hypothetical protein
MKMKKHLFFILLWSAGTSLFGTEPGTVLSLLGTYSKTGKITELELIHDMHGGAYILYVDDGYFHVLKQTGGALIPYTPDGFSRKPVRIRNLRSFEGTPAQYTAFIGREGDRDELFLFAVDYKGDLVYCPLRESRTAGSISEYTLACTMPDNVQIYMLIEEQLYCLSGAGTPEGMKRLYPVSLSGEKVKDFKIVLQSRDDGSRGWYTALANGNWKLSLFSMGTNELLVREQAGIFQAPPEVIAGEATEERVIYKIINGADVLVYREGTTGFFRDFSFRSPGRVKNYFTVTGSGAEIGLFLAEEAGTDVMYMVSNGTAAVPVLRPVAAMDRDGFHNLQLAVLPSGENRIFLFFTLEGRPHFAVIDSESGLETAGPFSGPEDRAIFFYSGGTDILRTCILDSPDNPSLMFYRYDRNNWIFERKTVIPIEIKNRTWLPETLPVLNPFYMTSEIILMTERDTLFLYDLGRDVYQVLEKQKYRWSGKINDILFMTLSGDDGIRLYCMDGCL